MIKFKFEAVTDARLKHKGNLNKIFQFLIWLFQNFCRYYLSLAHVASLFPAIVFTHSAPSFSEACSIQTLRSTNGILAVLCSVLVYEIIRHLRPNLDDRKATIYAVILALHPLHWFFTFLYYTDVASLTAVLAMYLACLKKNYWSSALVKNLLILFHDSFLIFLAYLLFIQLWY